MMSCLDKPEIYVHQEFVFNKEKEHVEVLKLICSVQVSASVMIIPPLSTNIEH